jgi:hypothetical protein
MTNKDNDLIGKEAFDFVLFDHNNEKFKLSDFSR